MAGKAGTTGGTGTGTSSAGQAGTANGGTSALGEGGAGGEAPIAIGGSSGSGGSGGSGGAGGSAGTAGTGGAAGAAGKGGTAGTAGTSGSGGSGGSVAVAKCADHPLSAKSTWIATASNESLGNGMETDGLYNPAKHMTDGLNGERWSSGIPQAGMEWIQIDFGVVVTLTQVTLAVFGNDVADYPRMYEVRISNTTGAPGAAVVASGAGATGSTVITLPSPITGQFLKVSQTGMDVLPDTNWWSIGEVNVTCAP